MSNLTIEDLVGADWSKVDPLLLHLFEEESDPSKFSGTIAAWVEKMVAENRLTDKSVPFLFRAVGPISYDIPDFELRGQIYPIFAGHGTFNTVLALAKDDNIYSVSADRGGPDL